MLEDTEMNEQRAMEIANCDIATLVSKEKTYQGSWKKRGGVGAFMMLARKWDRLENICRQKDWDIFRACIEDSGNTEGVREQIADLRRYLLLVEEHIEGERDASMSLTGKDVVYRQARESIVDRKR
jgi:hypothetical protein